MYSRQTQPHDLLLPHEYPRIVEQLIVYKNNDIKAFYGGPIERKPQGIQWLMPVVFNNKKNKTRAVYEVGFINCNLSNAHDADIFYINTTDVDIKFKNQLSQNYQIFTSLINGEYKDGKYIVIRSSDVAHVFFPDIFIASDYSEYHKNDIHEIIHLLATHFKTKNHYIDLSQNNPIEKVLYENETEIVYCSTEIAVALHSGTHLFQIEKRIKKQDIWKIYYLISKAKNSLNTTETTTPIIRIDSGCVSGQIYDDLSCDCLDQLHSALEDLACGDELDGLIIHIPGHDGRGFGSAPKAETEIYKQGNPGRINTPSIAINTIDAAQLLYNSEHYDIRSFDGAASVLQDLEITKVILLTDNIAKVGALTRHGIEVIRKKTNTSKETCNQHIEAKRNSPLYFSE